MRQIKKWRWIIYASFILPACYFGGGDSFDSNLILPSQTDLRSEGESSSRRRGSSGNGGKCEDSGACEDICEEVYDYDDPESEDLEGRVEACLDLRYQRAIKFEDILDVLREPSSHTLKNLDKKSFVEFLGISVGPWVAVAGEANDDEAKTLLAWIASEKEISKAFATAYRSYEAEYDLFEGVESLFDELSGGCSATLSRGKDFEDIACEKKDNYALAIYENICGGTISCRGRHTYAQPSDFPTDVFYRRGRDLLKYAVTVESVVFICPATLSDLAISNLQTSCLRKNSLSARKRCSEAVDAECEAGTSIGSGVIIEDNQILTNHHVVDRNIKTGELEGVAYKEFTVPGSVNSYSGEASLIDGYRWWDEDSDLALVQLRDSLRGATRPPFGCLSELSARDRLITIGQPAGRQWVISQGYLRSKSSDGPITCVHCLAYDFPDVVFDLPTLLFPDQEGVAHDQPGIAGGASGSPIFDEAGKLVGLIATVVVRSDGAERGWGYGPHIDRIKKLNDRNDGDKSAVRGVDRSCP